MKIVLGGRKEKDVIPCYITASGGAEGDVTAYTVPSGMSFTLTKVIFCFPIGTYEELEVYIKQADQRVFPLENSIKGDGVVLPFKTDIKYSSEEDIKIHYKNLNSTETRECFIFLCGVLK